MIQVKNIKSQQLSFASNDKNFQRCVEYIKLIDPDYQKYMPKKSKEKLSFELHNANSDIANALRRFLVDEIPVVSMDVDMKSIKTNDKYILADSLKKNIELIPISQDSDYSDIKISLSVNNMTDQIIAIHGRDIKLVKHGKKLKTSDYFSESIVLYNLRPMCSVNIPKIKLLTGVAKTDAGKFSALSNTGYEILDVKPSVQTKYKQSGKSSLNSTPKQFALSITTHRNASAKKIMKTCCSLITDRLSIIKKELDEIKELDDYFSQTINVEIKEDVYIFHFIGEYWTIANVISRYCFLENPLISFVCPGIVHPSIEECVVKIKHNQPKKIISNAIKKIIADVQVIAKAF